MWSSAQRQGQLQVWDVAAATVRHTLTAECSGFGPLLAVGGGTLWAGAHNGAIFTWDTARHAPGRELRGHTDAVRSLCRGGGGHVLSGAGSGDGTVVVWRDPGRPA